jgi:hypothetical protein
MEPNGKNGAEHLGPSHKLEQKFSFIFLGLLNNKYMGCAYERGGERGGLRK